MAVAVDAARGDFVGIVGAGGMVESPEERARLGIDGWTPDCVVYPASAQQAAQVLKCAAEHHLAVVACGGGTKLGVGNLPRRYDVALCLRKLQRVHRYEPSDLTVGVEAGLSLQELQNLVNRDGLWLPLDPPGGGESSLGGIAATNAAGPMRYTYGAPRDMVLGMQVATTEGMLIKTGGRVVKNVAGYDLGKLLIGSYGTLGVIVEVNLKLCPKPPERKTFILPTGTLGIARDVRRSVLHSAFEPMRMVLLDAAAAGWVHSAARVGAEAREPELWVEVSGSRPVMERVGREIERLGRAVGAVPQPQGDEGVQAAWRVIADFANGFAKSQPGAIVLRATTPPSSSEEFLSLAQQEAENDRIRAAGVSHPGAGQVYLGLLDYKSLDPVVGLVKRLRAAAEKLGGALIVLAAPGGLKERVDVWGTLGNAFKLMQKLKMTWDPRETLAPGRFVGSI